MLLAHHLVQRRAHHQLVAVLHQKHQPQAVQLSTLLLEVAASTLANDVFSTRLPCLTSHNVASLGHCIVIDVFGNILLFFKIACHASGFIETRGRS